MMETDGQLEEPNKVQTFEIEETPVSEQKPPLFPLLQSTVGLYGS